MRLLVCGSRNWLDSFAVWQVLTAMRPRAAVIHGAASGADAFADGWAKTQGIEVISFPADWKAHPKAAGPIRNARMLKDGRPDRGLAFGLLWKQVEVFRSPHQPEAEWRRTGTGDMVRRMLDVGLPVRWVSSREAPAVDLTEMPDPGGDSR